MKTCTQCKTLQDDTAFHRDCTRKTGYRDICKTCCLEYARTYRDGRSAERREYGKVWRAKNKEHVTRKNLEYSRANPRKFKGYALKRIYGITLTEFDAMIAEQEGRCAICCEILSFRPQTDHDHATGEVRGILCMHCNHGLGHFKDSPRLLHMAASYLNRPRILKKESA